MSRYIPDISTKRWVILSPHRLDRPDNAVQKSICPFCPGHEHETTLEVLRFGEGQANRPGWLVRVFPNKYPITDIHEVIVHSPYDDKDIEDLPLSHVELILKAYKERYNHYRKQGHVLIFCNHGEHAGASLDHPHSQVVVLPSQINMDTLVKEPMQNIVWENTFFNVYCPDFSQWPYEVWVGPKKDNTIFGDIEETEISDLARIMQKILKKLSTLYREKPLSSLPFGYNYYIYPKENWYLRIIPRFIHRAAFELGTGLSVNPLDPQDAAEILKKE